MSEQANNSRQDCKCLGEKRIKSLEKKIAELNSQVDELRAEIEIIKKVLTNR